MSFDSLLPLEYFFSTQSRAKQTFSSGFPTWNIPIWSKGYTRARVMPWYEQNLYTDLDRAYDESQIDKPGPTSGEWGSMIYQGGRAIVQPSAFIAQYVLFNYFSNVPEMLMTDEQRIAEGPQ